MLLGEKIRKLRRKRDWTIDQLAKKLSITSSYLGEIERGARTPSENVLNNLERIFRYDQLHTYCRVSAARKIRDAISFDALQKIWEIIDADISVDSDEDEEEYDDG